MPSKPAYTHHNKGSRKVLGRKGGTSARRSLKFVWGVVTLAGIDTKREIV